MALDFVAGCIGGCAGVLVGHPFDTVKVRLQTQDVRNPKYRGTLHCFATIVKSESLSGLFRGLSSPIVGVSLVNAVIFGVYGNTQKQFSDPDSLRTHFYAGMLAGSVQGFITGPLELVKTRLQVQQDSAKPLRTLQTYKHAKPLYSGPLDCAYQIVRKEGGIRALTKGLGTTLMRDAPAFAAYFASYEYFCRSVYKSDGGGGLSSSSLLMAGGMAGVVSWLVVYPVDVIKSRIQASQTSAGFLPTAKKMYAEEGPKTFFRGVNSAVIRAFPTNAAIFFTVNWVYSLYAKYNSGKAVILKVEERIVESTHAHYIKLLERLHMHTCNHI